MLWNPMPKRTFVEERFKTEAELEAAICKAAPALFGPSRIYLNVKRRVGVRGRTQNIPDGYLLDLASPRQPRLFVVEVELAARDPLRHIAVQILQFSISYEDSPQGVKAIVKEAVRADPAALAACQAYIQANDHQNLDFLLESVIFGQGKFSALVIIDQMPEDLAKVLISRFRFPVETLTFTRYLGPGNERLYHFTPFLQDVVCPPAPGGCGTTPPTDVSEIDTIVVPAREEGFAETFLDENRWYAIKIHASMLSRIKYIAAYVSAPTSAITHIAAVKSIEQWPDTDKYVVNFAEPAQKIGPLKLVPNGRIYAPRSPRYTRRELLLKATSLDEAF